MWSPLVDATLRFATPGKLNFVVTAFGSVAMYMFSLYKGFAGTTPALRRLFPGKPDVFYDRLDFVVVAFTGSVIGTIFFHPQDALQSLSAGFGWVGALSVLTNPKIESAPSTPNKQIKDDLSTISGSDTGVDG
ncbi:hypothetical protein [Terriglobus roseus]|uniref:Uncharacterized protein n=1 Tax=Terriglobus roseus TaxID=392734 RepID=A0A1G7Q0Y5_9BACT|nr:hypothetical protein [Terriglobus roseus]SDF92222.1 hypothetical protein SAMN05444167_3704 [Terriglobus roseus]